MAPACVDHHGKTCVAIFFGEIRPFRWQDVRMDVDLEHPASIRPGFAESRLGTKAIPLARPSQAKGKTSATLRDAIIPFARRVGRSERARSAAAWAAGGWLACGSLRAHRAELRHHWRVARLGIGVSSAFWIGLKQRKLVQWALAYFAASFALIQALDVVAQRFGWPDRIEKLIILVLAIGFFVALVLAWYHGERGVQRIGGVELLIIALLLAIGGALLWRYARTSTPTPPSNVAAKSVLSTSITSRPNLLAAMTAKIPEKSVAVL